MKYSNEECNSKNSTYVTECQPSFDTCVTIVLKPGRIFDVFFISDFIYILAILNQLLITKYCTKRTACEHQLNYTHSLAPCQPNQEGRSWGCVTCCGDRDLCNYDHSNRLTSNLNILLILFINFVLYRY